MKVDVSVCYYGKPYHTLLAIKSLLKYSVQHINKILITVEKKQPQNEIGGIYVLRDGLKGLPVEYFYPRYFYNLGDIDEQRARVDEAYRFQIPYQYPLERSEMPFVFVMHNDCLFHGDMLGAMIDTIQKQTKPVAGIGPIGQCWNCPASFEGLCQSSHFMDFKKSTSYLMDLMARHDIPRREITERLISEGKTHPLPECRLNEYASLINTALYKEHCLPRGPLVTYAGNWGGNDWGTVWFYQMVNQGMHFVHQTLEEFATHAPFNEVGNGISAYGNQSLYVVSEQRALDFLVREYGFSPKLTLKIKGLQSLAKLKQKAKKVYLKVRYA